MDLITDALGHAHALHRIAIGPKDPVAKLDAEVTAIRDLLYSDALALSRRGLIDDKRVEQQRSPSGYKNIAYDTLSLAALFREHEQAIAGKTPVTGEEVELAARSAEQLLAALGERDQAPAISGAASLLRQQAFTLFTSAYDEVRRAVAYLRWSANDVEAIAPSLWAGRGKRPTADGATPPVAPGGPNATVDAVTNTNDQGTVPTTAAPTASAAPGLPGSNPFLG